MWQQPNTHFIGQVFPLVQRRKTYEFSKRVEEYEAK